MHAEQPVGQGLQVLDTVSRYFPTAHDVQLEEVVVHVIQFESHCLHWPVKESLKVPPVEQAMQDVPLSHRLVGATDSQVKQLVGEFTQVLQVELQISQTPVIEYLKKPSIKQVTQVEFLSHKFAGAEVSHDRHSFRLVVQVLQEAEQVWQIPVAVY